MSNKVKHLLGIASVNPKERPNAIIWAQRLEWPVLILALWIPIQWYLEETGAVSLANAKWFDWLIWLVFLFETCLLTLLVRDKKHYLLTNWMNLVIIFTGIPFEWTYTPLIGVLRNLRLLMMLFLLLRLSNRIRNYLTRGHLGIMMIITGIVITLAGIIISQLDPAIGSIWDGMWYAWVTISHTGYGDIVPQTSSGRFFGGILILLGVVLTTVFTANLSAFLIDSRAEDTTRNAKKAGNQNDACMQEMMARLDRIERLLAEKKDLGKKD